MDARTGPSVPRSNDVNASRKVGGPFGTDRILVTPFWLETAPKLFDTADSGRHPISVRMTKGSARTPAGRSKVVPLCRFSGIFPKFRRTLSCLAQWEDNTSHA